MKKEGQSYAFLLSVALANGWINRSHNLAAYARTELTAADESYNDLIPRVEELDRCIRMCFKNTFTISKLLPIADKESEPKFTEEIEERIRQLVSEGKMEEALELSRKRK